MPEENGPHGILFQGRPAGQEELLAPSGTTGFGGAIRRTPKIGRKKINERRRKI